MISAVSSTPGTSGGAGTGANAAVMGGALNKDAFMQLLVAQMRHQDPLNPADGTAMASQLAQFSSLEQLINIGDALRTQADGSAGIVAAMDRTAALAMIGKTATVHDSTITVGDGATPWASVAVPSGGGALTLRVVDSAGRTVATQNVGVVDAGTQRVALDRVTRDLPAGSYQVAFDLATGTTVTHPAASVPVAIDGISVKDGQIVVTAGSQTYPLSAVLSVTARP